MWNGNRGAISLRVTLRGKHAHVGLRHLGINAFDKAFDVIAALRRLKRKVGKARLLKSIGSAEVEVLQIGESSHVSENSPLSNALRASVKAVTGRVPKFEMCPGLLENRWYVRRGIPALAYGPGLLTVSHGPREFVPIRNIAACAEIYALTALRFFNADNISLA